MKTDTKAEAELRDLAAWLDDVALALRKFSGASAPVMRDWMRAQAARTEGRALLARMATEPEARAEDTGLSPDAARFRANMAAARAIPADDLARILGTEPEARTVYVILHATSATYFRDDATAARPAWTRDVPRFKRFTTEAEAEAVLAALPPKTRSGAMVVECQERPVPLVATADHVAGSCEFYPVGGGVCPVCSPR